jgi:prepilin-type N-terminal cleavage/methylation domain-containing protein
MVFRGRRRGFSLIELMVVVAIALVVMAVSAPAVMRTYYGYRLRNTASSVAGLMQSARMQAVRNNTTIPVVLSADQRRYFADIVPVGGNGLWEPTEPLVELPRNVNLVTAGTPSRVSMNLAFAPVPEPQGSRPNFNARGLPCLFAGANCSNLNGGNPVGFVLYFRDQRSVGPNGWAAVSISPGGRIRVWTWNGTNWAT